MTFKLISPVEDDTNSRAADLAVVACYARAGYTGASLAGQEPARGDESVGLLQGSERPPSTPPRWRSPDPTNHSNPSQANLR